MAQSSSPCQDTLVSKRVGVILLASLVVLACGPEADGHSGPIVAFRGVNVVPMLSEGVLADQTVVVEGGVVVRMGPSASVDVPPGATVIEGEGHFLLPGLTDLHVHIESEDELALYLINGVTTIMNMRGREWHLDLQRRLGSGDQTGPRLFTCGPYVRGVTDPEEVRNLVDRNVDAGYDCVKNRPPMSSEAYAALHESARARGIPVYGHAPRNLGFAAVLAHPAQRLAHLEEMIYPTDLGLYVDQYRAWESAELPDDDPAQDDVLASVQRLARAVADAGIWVVPTEVVIDTYAGRTTDRFEELVTRSYVQYLDPIDQRRWARAGLRQGAARFSQQLKLQQLLLAELREAGARIALGTDAATGSDLMVMPGWSVHRELQLLVQAGFSPYEALYTATVAPAEFLGLDDGSGTVRVGARADLMLVEHDPLEDVSQVSMPIGVTTQGRWVERSELEAQLEAISRSRAPLETALAIIDERLDQGGPAAAVEAYVGLAAPPERVGPYLESSLSALAYRTLRSGQVDRAIDIFELIASTFADSPNAHDSLGEAYLARGDTAQAIAEYERALDLDPSWTNAEDVLAELARGQP